MAEIKKIIKGMKFEDAQKLANRIIKKEGGFPVELQIHPDGSWTFITENSDICGIGVTTDIGTIDFTDEYIGRICLTEYLLRNKSSSDEKF